MSPKIEHVLNCAMTILKESGNQGLTMRKVAETAGMRLSNVQYYFKTKELLLEALLEGFLLDYAESMQLLSVSDNHDSEKKLKLFASLILNYIDRNDCVVVFKEIWVIAERNSGVKKAVDEYYKKLHSMLFEALKQAAPENCNSQQLDNAVVILLPFIEGYCITSCSLNVSTKEVSEQLGGMLYKILSESNQVNTNAT